MSEFQSSEYKGKANVSSCKPLVILFLTDKYIILFYKFFCLKNCSEFKFLIILFLFYVYEWFTSMYVCAPDLCLMQRVLHFQELDLDSYEQPCMSSARKTSSFNHWTVTPRPLNIFSLVHQHRAFVQHFCNSSLNEVLKTTQGSCIVSWVSHWNKKAKKPHLDLCTLSHQSQQLLCTQMAKKSWQAWVFFWQLKFCK